jgi:C1A family cysteine protease
LKIATQVLKTITTKYNITREEVNIFDNFKNRFSKKYDNDDIEAKSLVNVAMRERNVEKQNQKFSARKSKFKTGIWEYSDLSAEEIKKSMTGLIRKPNAKSFYKSDFPQEVPDYVNYTEAGLVSPVLNQGICGCCWAISALGALEGQIAKSTGKPAVKLSEQNLIDCNKDEREGNWGCDGGDMENVYNYIMKKSRGVNAASFYRYKGAGEFRCQYNPKNSVATVKDYVKVETGDENLLMRALAHVGPLSVAVDASSESFQNYQSGVYDDPDCGNDINHAVLLVGYGWDYDEGPYWIVKNSWGKSYGENGYIRIAKDRGNLCGIANEISYPIV